MLFPSFTPSLPQMEFPLSSMYTMFWRKCKPMEHSNQSLTSLRNGYKMVRSWKRATISWSGLLLLHYSQLLASQRLF
ncbi:hypothetical protein L210DRAFT_730129 [Boletus edulis BED1]|uniref:Uncharacterized protein n=1 Tax=Boletus edulis BED1 TaxID=1328754 RepID=A0AAD4G5K9_BOLED|nr:hypothetical protein L210DRAFT_730129 [Boletus edulis BED1]